MIMQGSTPIQLRWSALLDVIGIAVVMLPFVPTVARSQDSGEGPPINPQEVVRGEVERARAELVRARADVERALKQLDEA